MQKTSDGNVRTFELDEVAGDNAYAGYGGIAQAIDGLIAPGDVKEVSDELLPGTTALIVLFEHVWLRDLRQAVEISGGQVLLAERIPGEVVDAVERAALGEGD